MVLASLQISQEIQVAGKRAARKFSPVQSVYQSIRQYPMRNLTLIIYGLVWLMLSATASGSGFFLNIADIASPVFTAHGIRLTLPADGSASLQIASLKAELREFRDVRLHCGGFTLTSAQMACRNGHLDAAQDLNLDFTYDFITRHVKLALTGKGGESWQVTGKSGDRGWQIFVQMHNAQFRRLASLLPPGMPSPTAGGVDGTVRVDGNTSGLQRVNVDAKLAEAAFTDASGLHAADKLRGDIGFSAARNGKIWHWQGNIAWTSGEVFWQPLYLKGGAALNASGTVDGNLFSVEQAVADLHDAGRVQFSAGWDLGQGQLRVAALQGENLALSNLFTDYAKPFLEKGALADSSLYGHADVKVQFKNGALQSLKLGLHDAGIADAAQRFVLLGVNTDIDWQADALSVTTVSFAGGTLLGAPIGAGQWAVEMNGLEFNVPQAVLSVLDGKITLHDFHLHRDKGAWHWQFSGALGPISMEQFSHAAGWPVMLGTLAGRIPRVSFDDGEIDVDGALLFNLFDGTVVATQLKLADAFGRAPRLSGNLTMRNLDLDLLTRTFSFGNMQGRLDADVHDLQLQAWRPVRFEARLYSSAGNYPKKISQKAVQNISSLGGAGAAAAIQRSYLSFFKNFGYDRIGWSCVLRNGVCEMGGIEGENHGAYAIIGGGGIPAISVMGYNRAVSWDELITRLKRVTQDNVKPVIN